MGTIQDDALESSFRSISRTRKGPFHVFGYALARKETSDADLEKRLRDAIVKEVPAESVRIVIDRDEPGRTALERECFQKEVLSQLDPEKEAPAASHKPSRSSEIRNEAKVRERLRQAVAGLPDLLLDVDRTLSKVKGDEAPPKGDTPAESAEPEASLETDDVAPAQADVQDSGLPASLVTFLTFEDLGIDAERIASVLDLLIRDQHHVVVLEDGLDTRTREGRVVARAALRLGSVRSIGAREQSKREAQKRRDSLKVYGPIPYGFTRLGSELHPVEEEVAIVRRMRDLAYHGRKPAEILTTLHREQKSWKDGTPWTWRRVAQVLKNPIYEKMA